MPVQFCRNCINMLYPKENTAKRRADGTRELVYACRNCDYTQVVKTPRDPVYRNLLSHDATYVLFACYLLLCPYTNLICSEKMAISYDVVLDPTLPHTYNYTCPECGHQEAVYLSLIHI